MLELNKIHHGDCLDLMKDISDSSISMILCDLPYQVTALKWDKVIPFEPLWEQYERIIKDDGAIVLTASQPFTSALVMSKPQYFRHEWIWNKKMGSNFFNVKHQPLKVHESILVFSKKKAQYYPSMRKGKMRNKGNGKDYDDGIFKSYKNTKSRNDLYYPISILEYSNANRKNKLHPTQKNADLFEYLIRTYTKDENAIVLDNCIGSGTTAIAALRCGRNFIGIEKDAAYVEIANNRIAEIRG